MWNRARLTFSSFILYTKEKKEKKKFYSVYIMTSKDPQKWANIDWASHKFRTPLAELSITILWPKIGFWEKQHDKERLIAQQSLEHFGSAATNCFRDSYQNSYKSKNFLSFNPIQITTFLFPYKSSVLTHSSQIGRHLCFVHPNSVQSLLCFTGAQLFFSVTGGSVS